ncbi:hypothetical protein BT93_H0495 [Corymbia citriodora subsp. variegata]|nr:hypothetical protein BT93_H0495 [Corymbia citriodora subsp. variegata]
MIQHRGLNVIAKWEHFPCFEVEGKLWLINCGGQDVEIKSPYIFAGQEWYLYCFLLNLRKAFSKAHVNGRVYSAFRFEVFGRFIKQNSTDLEGFCIHFIDLFLDLSSSRWYTPDISPAFC